MTRLILLLVISIAAFGQSLYHRVGYGNFVTMPSVYDAGVGYATSALRDSTTLLNSNAAAWHHLNRVYFRMSSSSTRYQLLDPESVGGSAGSPFILNQSGFSQMQIGLPVGQNLGFSLGLEPITNMASYLETETGLGTVTEDLSGGTWRFYAGFGWALNDIISLGLRADLINGYYRRESTIQYDSTVVDGGYEDITRIQGNILGSAVHLGIQAQLTPDIALGATVGIPMDKPVFDGRVQLAGTDSDLGFSEELTDWPIQLGAGISYQYRERLLVMAGLSQTIFTDESFAEANFFAVPEGWSATSIGEFQLGLIREAYDPASRRWTERVELRSGFYTRNFYLTPVSEQLIYEYFATGGIGIPLLEGRSRLDAAIEIGKRTSVDNYPDEWITRLRFGVQLYERWFRNVKRR